MGMIRVLVVMVGLFVMLIAIVFGYLAARDLGEIRNRPEAEADMAEPPHRYLVLAVVLLFTGALMVLLARI